MKLTFIALFVAATVQGQDYYDSVDKRGGDARFATGVMGAGFNRISKKTKLLKYILPKKYECFTFDKGNITEQI